MALMSGLRLRRYAVRHLPLIKQTPVKKGKSRSKKIDGASRFGAGWPEGLLSDGMTAPPVPAVGEPWSYAGTAAESIFAGGANVFGRRSARTARDIAL